MQIQFSKTKTYHPEFNDNLTLPQNEQVIATIQVCELGELLQLMDAFKEAGVGDQLDTNALDVEKTRMLVDATKGLLPKHVSVAGLKGDDGDLTIEDVVKYGPLFPLAAELLGKLAEYSSPTADDEGN